MKRKRQNSNINLNKRKYTFLDQVFQSLEYFPQELIELIKMYSIGAIIWYIKQPTSFNHFFIKMMFKSDIDPSYGHVSSTSMFTPNFFWQNRNLIERIFHVSDQLNTKRCLIKAIQIFKVFPDKATFAAFLFSNGELWFYRYTKKGRHLVPELLNKRLTNVASINSTKKFLCVHYYDQSLELYGCVAQAPYTLKIMKTFSNVSLLNANVDCVTIVHNFHTVSTYMLEHDELTITYNVTLEQHVFVKQLCSTGNNVFAALLNNGHLVVWCRGTSGNLVRPEQMGYSSIVTCCDALVGITKENKAVTIYPHNVQDDYGGNFDCWKWQIPQDLQTQQVKTICATGHAFAALTVNGEVFSWGAENNPNNPNWLRNVNSLSSNLYMFMATEVCTNDNSKTTRSWGRNIDFVELASSRK
jgi:hypothetical protein